jgi:hypothetical protein
MKVPLSYANSVVIDRTHLILGAAVTTATVELAKVANVERVDDHL